MECAGAVVALWAGRMNGLPRPLPVEPLHGQLPAPEAVPPLLRHVVDTPRCYLVPCSSGRVIIGATVERTGDRKAVTLAPADRRGGGGGPGAGARAAGGDVERPALLRSHPAKPAESL